MFKRARELSHAHYVWDYISKGKEFDSAIWYPYDDGFLLLPYNNGYWLEDKIWFPSLLNLNQFCMMCNCKIIMESGEL